DRADRRNLSWDHAVPGLRCGAHPAASVRALAHALGRPADEVAPRAVNDLIAAQIGCRPACRPGVEWRADPGRIVMMSLMRLGVVVAAGAMLAFASSAASAQQITLRLHGFLPAP